MSTVWTPPQTQPPTQRYTEKQLLDAAKHIVHGGVKPRTIRTFIELGLLDNPRRKWPGHGGSSSPGSWSRQQFDLWCTLLHHRKSLIARYGNKAHIHATLCTVVVGAWLYFGEASGIPLTQVKRAMHTWANMSASVGHADAVRNAMQFVRTAAHPAATDRVQLRHEIADMLYQGRFPERDDLLEKMVTLVDPDRRGAYKGPAEAPISAENLTDMVLGREEMLNQLRSNSDSIPDGLWEWARFVLLWTRNWYHAALPRLADDPSLRKYPELAHLYEPDNFDSLMNAACQDFLSVLSVAELAKQAAHLPPEQRPEPWLAGQFQLKIASLEQLATLLHLDGSRQRYLEVSIQLIRSDDAR